MVRRKRKRSGNDSASTSNASKILGLPLSMGWDDVKEGLRGDLDEMEQGNPSLDR